jgi:hypothetical protein
VTGDAASSRRIHAHVDRIMKSLGFAARESKSSATLANAEKPRKARPDPEEIANKVKCDGSAPGHPWK